MKNVIEKIHMYGVRKSLLYAFQELIQRPLFGLVLKSYSQKGEDLFMDTYFQHKKDGFYVDVGANDPDRFNNTKKFYQKGWRGINIEPDTHNYNKFLKRSEE